MKTTGEMRFELKKPDLTACRAGNTGVEGVWHWDSGQPGRHVMVSALIHGNELCGAWALKQLLESGIKPVAGSLTLAFCNLAAFDRFDPERHDDSRFVDEDMNRIWADNKLADPTTSERQRANQLLPYVKKADWLLDLHSMHEPGAPLILTGLQARNLNLARELGAPQHIIVDAGHSEGVRMRDYGRFGDLGDTQSRSLLVECGFHGEIASLDVALDVTARFLSLSDVVGTHIIPSDWYSSSVNPSVAVQVTQAVVAQSMDMRFVENWQGLQRIPSAGTLLAIDGERQYVTPYDDCTLIMPSLRQLRPGVTVMRLAQSISAI